jgi:hypothetical protein
MCLNTLSVAAAELGPCFAALAESAEMATMQAASLQLARPQHAFMRNQLCTPAVISQEERCLAAISAALPGFLQAERDGSFASSGSCGIDGFFTDTMALRSADAVSYCSHGCNHVARKLLRACGTSTFGSMGTNFVNLQPASPASTARAAATSGEMAMVALLPRLRVVSDDAVCSHGLNTSNSSKELPACMLQMDAFAAVDAACAGMTLDSVDCDAPCLHVVLGTRNLLGPCFASLEALRVTHAISGAHVFLDKREASRTLAIDELCVRRVMTPADFCSLELRRLQEAAEQGVCNLASRSIDAGVFTELQYHGCFILVYDMARHCSWLIPSSPHPSLKSTVVISVLAAVERWPVLARFGDGFGLASVPLHGGGRLHCALFTPHLKSVEVACSSALSDAACSTACLQAVTQLRAISAGCFPVLLRAAEASVLRAIARATDRSSAMFWRPDCVAPVLDGTESCQVQWLLLVGLQDEHRCALDGIDPTRISDTTARKLCDDGCTDVFAAAVAACRGVSARSVPARDRLEFLEFNRLVAKSFLAVMLDLGVVDSRMALSLQGKSAEHLASILLSFNINAAGFDGMSMLVLKNAAAVAAGNSTAARAVAYGAEPQASNAFDSFLQTIPLLEALTPSLCTRSGARCAANSGARSESTVRILESCTSLDISNIL